MASRSFWREALVDEAVIGGLPVARGSQAPPVLHDVEGRPVLARAEGVGRAGDRLRGREGAGAPGKRADLQRLSRQKLYPVIEFENGSIYREESKCVDGRGRLMS